MQDNLVLSLWRPSLGLLGSLARPILMIVKPPCEKTSKKILQYSNIYSSSKNMHLIAALELLPLDCSRLQHDKSRGSNFNAGKMDQTWSYLYYIVQDAELGTEVTTITTTDGENVQVVIKSVERRGHHEAAPSTITANTVSSADLTPNVQTVTTSDGTCTNVVRTHNTLKWCCVDGWFLQASRLRYRLSKTPLSAI